MTPLVSVVMSLYNDSAFVEDAVRSILNQTFANFEFIIVDDGSKDDSVTRVEKFQDARIRLIRQPNRGLAAALNVAIRSAVGTYIARQDADDISTADRLERQLTLFKSHPALGLVGCNAFLVNQEGGIMTQTNLPIINEKIQQDLMSDTAGNPFIHGATIYRRDCALRIGCYRVEFQQAQDIDLWLRIAEHYQLANLQDVGYFWRLRRGGTGERRWETQRDYGRLARMCAQKRRAEEVEPLLSLASVRGNSSGRFFSYLRQSASSVEYEMKIGMLFFDSGCMADARIYLFHVVRNNPVYLYAWLLLILSFSPHVLAVKLRKKIQKLYRLWIWND